MASRAFKAATLAVGRAVAAVAGLVGGAVLSRVLAQDEYGVWRQTRLVYETVAPLLMLGLPKALLYFIPRDPQRARGVLIEHLITLMIGGGIFALALAVGGNHALAWAFDTPALSLTLLILIPYPLFMFPMSAVQACLIAQQQVSRSALFPVISQVISLALIIGAALIWPDPVAVLVALVVGSAITAPVGLWLMWASTAGTEGRFEARNGLEHLRYAVPLGLASTIGTLSRKLDQFIVSSTATTAEAAVYFNGAMELPLIGVVSGSINAILLPDMAKMYQAGDRHEILALWQRAMSKSLLLLAPTMVGVLWLAPEIMRVLFSDVYAASATPFRVYALLLPARSAVYGAVLMAAGRTASITRLTVFMLVSNAILSIALVSWLGPVGAAWATVISTYLVIGGFVREIGQVLDTPAWSVIPWRAIFVVLGLSALAGAPVGALMLWDGWATLGDFTRLVLGGGVFAMTLAAAYQLTGQVSLRALFKVLRRR